MIYSSKVEILSEITGDGLMEPPAVAYSARVSFNSDERYSVGEIIFENGVSTSVTVEEGDGSYYVDFLPRDNAFTLKLAPGVSIKYDVEDLFDEFLIKKVEEQEEIAPSKRRSGNNIVNKLYGGIT